MQDEILFFILSDNGCTCCYARGTVIMTTAQIFLKKFNTMKTLPHVAIRLAKLISSENSTLREFEKVIKLDPILVLRLIRLINSPYYGLLQKVESISRIIVLIGTKNLRNMVVTAALKEIFKENSSSKQIFSRPHLWLHCAAVSICSQMISERIFGIKGDNAFLCGILHDIGMIVEDQIAPELFLQVCDAYEPGSKSFAKYEKEIIGTNHCEVGYLLAREWKLPAEVQKGIRRHHNIQDEMSPSNLSGIIQISEYIVSKLDYTAIPGIETPLSPCLETYLSENIDEYKILFEDLPEEVKKAEEIYKPDEE